MGYARFLRSFDETLDGGLILPRGLTETVAALAEQAGSRLERHRQARRRRKAGVHLHRFVGQ